MDSNFAAQSQYTKDRLDARRAEAEAERLLREGTSGSRRGLWPALMQLLRRSSQPRQKKEAEAAESATLAAAGKSRGQ